MLRGFQQQGLKRIRTDTKAVVENDTTAAPDARELSANGDMLVSGTSSSYHVNNG
jgi:hypothetical protein